MPISATLADPDLRRSIGTPPARGAGDISGNRGGHRQTFVPLSGICRRRHTLSRPVTMGKQQEWWTILPSLIDRFRIDAANQRIASDPWQWKIHCMVTSWRLRNSHGTKVSRKRCRRLNESWETAAHRIRHNLLANAKQQTRMLTWEHWAQQRSRRIFRYIKQSNRSTDSDPRSVYGSSTRPRSAQSPANANSFGIGRKPDTASENSDRLI